MSLMKLFGQLRPLLDETEPHCARKGSTHAASKAWHTVLGVLDGLNPKRLEVFDAISTERAYQDEQVNRADRPDMKPQLEMGEVLTAIRVNLMHAELAWYTGSGNHAEAMEFLRKVGALTVQAGETFGMPERNQFDIIDPPRGA